MMSSLFDKIRFRLQDHCESGDCRKFCHECDFKTALRIVDEVEAEYGNGWIPCNSGRMPSSHESRKVWITIVYPCGRCTRKAVWNGWCFEWENGKYIDTNVHKIAAWMPYHAPEPWKPEKGE